MTDVKGGTLNWENRILARILLDNNLLQAPAFASLESEDFQDDKNMLIFATMKCLEREGREIDLVSVADQLHVYGELENAGGSKYLASLVDYIPGAQS